MMQRLLLAAAGAAYVLGAGRAALAQADSPRPNVVLIYSDDVGYGDPGCYGATKIKTPNIDRLASEGLKFTDAHSPAATCTPSRYALLTGEYAWRKKGTGILPGDANLIIDTSKQTLPKVFADAGYTTGIVGKWHLGLGDKQPIDWNADVAPGPKEVGFASSFIVPATNDRVPCVYMQDGKVVNLEESDPIQVSYGKKIGDEPTGKEHPELLKMKLSHGHDATIINGISRIGFMTGGKKARWIDEDMGHVLAEHAVSYIDEHKSAPFFLYFAPVEVHVPRTPSKEFVGTSEAGLRGDSMQELDWMVGQVLDAIDKAGIADKTMVIFTSDNGPVWDDGYDDGSKEGLGGHDPAGPWRGRKGTPYEGGTRVPMIVRWPGMVQSGGESDVLLTHADFLASFATMFDQQIPEGSARDSVNLTATINAKAPPARTHLVEYGSRRSAIRQGDWKLIFDNDFPANEGGARGKRANNRDGAVELFNLKEDPTEATNVAEQHEDKVKELEKLLEEVKDGSDRAMAGE